MLLTDTLYLYVTILRYGMHLKNAKLHISELLLTINSTETSVQRITLLLYRMLKQHYFKISNNFRTYERYFQGIRYFLYSRADISPNVGTFNSETYDRT